MTTPPTSNRTASFALPRLIGVQIPVKPVGVVLVLHGGASRKRDVRVSPTQLSVLRMIPVARRIARAGQRQLAVMRLLNVRRGWDNQHTPVSDVKWALKQVSKRFGPDVPVCLVGHSLGARAALLSAGQPQVKGVVALAPWLLPSEAMPAVSGKPIVIIHGDQDRIASPDRSCRVAQLLARETTVSYVTVTGGKHAMLSRRDMFDGLAAHCAVWILLGRADDENVALVAAGQSHLTV